MSCLRKLGGKHGNCLSSLKPFSSKKRFPHGRYFLIIPTDTMFPHTCNVMGLRQLSISRSCEGVMTLFGTERFFSGTHNRVALEGRGCWGRVITNVCMCKNHYEPKHVFFSSNCQVYRLCSCIGCKWRTSFCHSKAPWDGWQSCLFPHSCFFKPGIF